MDRTTDIPVELFSRLRHTDPFIRLPEPIIIPLEGGQGLHARVTGFFVTGRVRIDGGDYATCSTHSPKSQAIGACAGGWVEHADGTPFLTASGAPDVLWCRLAIDPEFGSIDGMVRECIKRFVPTEETADPTSYVTAVLPQVVAALIYCCAENADLEDVPVPPLRGKGGKRVRNNEAPRPVRVGYRVGKAIQRGRIAVGARRVSSGDGSSGGWVMPPHIRSPHFQRFRHGRGRVEVKVRWVDPVEVNMHLGETVPTVRQVRAAAKSSR